MTRVEVATPLGTVVYHRHGEAGAPAVLLWHSLYVDGRSWDGVLPALTAGRTVLVVDGPCHGESPGPARDFTLDDCVDVALAVLDHAKLDAVDVVGNAWGGHVGVLLAARAPARVRSLVAMCSPMQALRPDERRKLRVLGGLLRLVGWRRFLRRALEGAMLHRPARADASAYLARAARGPGRARTLRAMRSVALGRPSLVERLADIRCPTLFVVGAGSALWPPALAREQATRLADGRVEVLADVGHLPPVEAPEATAALVTRWLAR
jgi:pimeloyl-ACP methyl ester carboxylesterase